MKFLQNASVITLFCACLSASLSAQTDFDFVDVSRVAGINPYQMEYGKGGSVAAADFDDDGDIDLFLPNAAGVKDQLYRNRGDGSFEEIAETAGLAHAGRSRVALWFDYDGDHNLDLFVAGDCWQASESCADTSTLRLYRQVAAANFQDVSVAAGLSDDLVVDNRSHRGGMCAGDVNNDGYLDLLIGLWTGEARLLLNGTDGTFSDISISSGVGGTADRESHWQPMMYDFNQDGWLDIYANIDFHGNKLWLNQGDLTFLDVAEAAGVANAWNDMGLTLGDYDNDGDMDIYITNIETELTNNVLYRNDSRGEILRFIRATSIANVAAGGFGWGCTFFDANNDGWLDLAATNGFFNGPGTADSSRFWLNNGQEPVRFLNKSGAVGFDDTYWGSALVAADYDRDGDLDLIQACNGSGPSQSLLRVLENRRFGPSASNNYLVIKPRISGPNHRAIGAIVHAQVGQNSMLRPISAGTSAFGQEPAEAFFGVGRATVVDRVVVDWPDGTETVLHNVPANQELLIEHRSPPQLLFTDLTTQAGIGLPNTLTESVAWGDYDNDGDEDLYLTNDGPNRLFRNDGEDTFTDVTAATGVGNALFSVGTAFGDLDNDGDLDLYVVNFQSGPDALYRNDGPTGPSGEYAFTDIAATAGIVLDRSSRGMAFFDFDRDGLLDIYVNAIGPDILYHNEGDLQFIDVAAVVGIVGAPGQGVGVVGTDLNKDGLMDIYNANRSGDLSNLFLNSNGTFSDIATAAGVNALGLGMGILAFDYDNDLDMDLYWTVWPGSGSTSGNVLYQNQGGGSLFVDVADATATRDPLGWGISCNAGDIDNDRWMDFFVTNGFDSSTSANVLFRNLAGTSFENVTAAIGGGAWDGRGVAFSDYDLDGDLDLCVTGDVDAETRLWRNDTNSGNHWIVLRLQGVTSNRSAIGTWVEVTAGGLTTAQEVSGGAGRGSFNSLPLEFGLGASSQIDSIVIRWPGGHRQLMTDVPADNYLTIHELNATNVDQKAAVLPLVFSLAQNSPNPFNPTTRIEYQLANDAKVSLTVHDLLGREVRTLLNRRQTAGRKSVIWDGRSNDGRPVASGVYIYTLHAAGQRQSRKMVLLQ